MKKLSSLLIIIIIISSFSFSKDNKTTTSSKKKGTISKIGDAATRGYGWQLGKEAAKETIKSAKKIVNSDGVKKIKEKTRDKSKKLKNKIKESVK